MGSYDNIVKIEEIRKHMEEGNVQSAQKILDTMDIKKLKNMSDLSLLAEVYTENERYEEAASLFLKIYDKTKSRKSLYQLVNLSILNNKAEEAQNYLKEYQKLAPRDFYRYIFQYKIDKLKGEPYEKLIETLETLKNTEYIEKWAYELAKTYYKAGKDQECIRECSDIILWFGEGVYVEKAKILKSYFTGGTDKAKIMEELRRRASEDKKEQSADSQVNNIVENSAAEQEYGYRVEEGIEEEDTQKDITNQLIMEQEIEEQDMIGEDILEEASDISKLAIEDETDEFENYLKNDVQNMMREAWEEDNKDSWESDNSEDLSTSYPDFVNEEPEEKRSITEQQEVAAPTQKLPEAALEREHAEQEVEAALYQLLEEEELDEDDRKLRNIAEKLQIDVDKMFGHFLHVKAIKKQLAKSLEGILDEHTRSIQIIITGTEGSGKTTLAKDITLFLNQCGKLKSSKIAKIKAEKLNTIDIIAKKDTLKDCCLVVENASELRRQTIDSILELCNILKGNIAVIFEENKLNMNKLFRECPKLMDLFKNRIHLPGYTPEDFIGFAYACLKQQDYHLDAKAATILREKVNQIVKQEEPQIQLEQISNLMQSVMNTADIRMGRLLSNLAASGKLKDVDVLTVLTEDFIKP